MPFNTALTRTLGIKSMLCLVPTVNLYTSNNALQFLWCREVCNGSVSQSLQAP